jgi:hypothetical protein
MTEVEKFAFEDHYFDCAECADDVRAAALMREGVKEGMLGAVAPAPVRTAEPADEVKRGIIHAMPQRSSTVPAQRTSWHRSVVLPWAAAATLAVAVGYQALTPGGNDFTGDSPALQVLAPVTLRPASRGAVPAITVAGDAPLTLALDVNAPEGTRELAYALTTPDNSVGLEGRIAAPAPGSPLFLLVSPSTFPAAGRYSLAVRDAARDELLGEYAFDVNLR